MDWSGFWAWSGWTAVAALSEMFGAAATVAAVWIALQQTRDAATPKLLVRASREMGAKDTRDHTHREADFYTFTAVNVGQRPVTLIRSDIRLPGGETLDLQDLISEKFPCTLLPEEQVEYTIPVKEIIQRTRQCGYHNGRLTLQVRFTDARHQHHSDVFWLDLTKVIVLPGAVNMDNRR